MNTVTLKIVCVGSLAALAAGVASGAPEYTVTDLGSFGGDIAAVDLGEGGTVVGWGVVNRFDYQMFVYDGVLTPIGPPAGDTQAQATGINADGSVLGVGYSMGDIVYDALVHDLGVTTIVGAFTPTAGAVDGRIIGVCPIATTDGFVIEAACVVNGGVLSTLATLPGGHDAAAFDTSGEGWVVGGAFANGSIRPTPVAWIGSAPIDLGTLGGAGGQARAINANRQVAGWAVNGAGQPHGFVYDLNAAGTVLNRTDLGTLDGKASHARDLNNDSVVVGTSGSRAFIHRDGIMIDLNTLIDPTSGWTLVDATAINNQGQIVGHGHTPGHPLRAFMLSPAPCLADLSGDGIVDAGDLGLFISFYLAGDLTVDFTDDGIVDAGDLSAFITSFLAGC